MNELLVFFASVAAALLSAMSGGGTEIIMYPVLLWLGFPLPLIIAVGLITNVFWAPLAAYNYLRERRIDWNFILTFSAIGLIGSYGGVLLILNLNQHSYQVILGTVILALVIYTYFTKELGLIEQERSTARSVWAYPFALLLGFYEQVLGAGNAIAFNILTFYTKGFDLIEALGHYYTIVFAWSVFGATLLISKGYFDVPIMIAATVGSVIGAYVGSRYARYKGNKFIKTLLLFIGGIVGLKLLLGL